MTHYLESKPIFKEPKPDLIPCPFCCDDDPRIERDSDRSQTFFGYCDICESYGPIASTIQDAARKWNERKYSPKHHPELEKIAERLGKMNRPEHEAPFNWESTYDTEPRYWRVAEIVLTILDDYDRQVRSYHIRVANLFAKIKTLIAEDFDEDLESWEGPEEEPEEVPE